MSQAKRASKGKRTSKAVSVLGIAGASLAATTSGSMADIFSMETSPLNTVPPQAFAFGDEEISDVSLASFRLFAAEDLGTSRLVQVAAHGGCGCGHGGGCGGHGSCGGRGCGGHGGCGRG